MTASALVAGAGDRAALERFIRATQRDVWRLVAHLGGVGVADDLTQEVYLRALRSLPGFEGRSSARTWLLSIARRTVVDHVRAAVARPSIAWSTDYREAADNAVRPGHRMARQSRSDREVRRSAAQTACCSRSRHLTRWCGRTSGHG